ncbi:sexual stage-specific protein G37, putative, partial [Hepatocystis sp. ex Piliocolobus tephrosceles]
MKIFFLFLLLLVVFHKKATVVESIIQKQNVYLDDEFKSFTYFFASSPSASFLSKIVRSDESRFMQTRNKIDIWRKTVDVAYSINQISNNIMKVYMSIVLLFLLPLFSYIGIFGIARKHVAETLSSILAYFTFLILFFLTNGILNIGFMTSLPLVFAILVFNIAKSDCTIRTLYKYKRYVFCFVISKLVYDVITSLNVDKTNAYNYGFSGYLYINMLNGSYYIILKILHLSVLSMMSFQIFKMFSRFFSNDTLKSRATV